MSNHWCPKADIVPFLKGKFNCELENRELFKLNQGMTYFVSDELSLHRSVTVTKPLWT
ncbi:MULTISPECIES: hypothetical protein [Flavobacterium]|uniref:hypothetical protein n=1 Tax=Flavobacterium TaxID=237 RepID=UPI0022AC4ACA|nr:MULTISPECIES: hypothetical protein [Flavobacterium]